MFRQHSLLVFEFTTHIQLASLSSAVTPESEACVQLSWNT